MKSEKIVFFMKERCQFIIRVPNNKYHPNNIKTTWGVYSLGGLVLEGRDYVMIWYMPIHDKMCATMAPIIYCIDPGYFGIVIPFTITWICWRGPPKMKKYSSIPQSWWIVHWENRPNHLTFNYGVFTRWGTARNDQLWVSSSKLVGWAYDKQKAFNKPRWITIPVKSPLAAVAFRVKAQPAIQAQRLAVGDGHHLRCANSRAFEWQNMRNHRKTTGKPQENQRKTIGKP